MWRWVPLHRRLNRDPRGTTLTVGRSHRLRRVCTAEGLFEKKLTKAEKKIIAEERRKARKEAKLAKQAETGEEG